MFERGDVVVAIKDDKSFVGRILRIISSRRQVEIQFWADDIKRFLVRDFSSDNISHASKEQKEYLRDVAREHNRVAIGITKCEQRRSLV